MISAIHKLIRRIRGRGLERTSNSYYSNRNVSRFNMENLIAAKKRLEELASEPVRFDNDPVYILPPGYEGAVLIGEAWVIDEGRVWTQYFEWISGKWVEYIGPLTTDEYKTLLPRQWRATRE